MAIPLLIPRARIRLRMRMADARRLIEIHEECTGIDPGRRRGYDALNRSTIILAVAAWEGFTEDLLEGAVAHLARRGRGPSVLPTNVCDAMIAHMYTKHGWDKLNAVTKSSVWSLTGRGWRTEYIGYARDKLVRLHTPNHGNIKKLYSSIIGLSDFSSSWGAARWRPEDYIDRLDDLLLLRHQIAHGSIKRETVGKTRAKAAINMIEKISGWTHKRVDAHLRQLVK